MLPRCWFKGADTRAACSFLEWRYQQHLQSSNCPCNEYMTSIYNCLQAANACLRCMYSHGLWISPTDAGTILRCGYDTMRHYLDAASMALSMHKTRFKITPKLHAFNHCMDYLLQNPSADWMLNPCIFSTQQDEDFVGRISALSCAVSVKSVHRQTGRMCAMGRQKIAVS